MRLEKYTTQIIGSALQRGLDFILKITVNHCRNLSRGLIELDHCETVRKMDWRTVGLKRGSY